MSNYAGLYRALIYDLDDPEKRDRARLYIPAILGTSPSGWATAAFPGSLAAQGDAAWVLFENGDLNRPTWMTSKGDSRILDRIAAEMEVLVAQMEVLAAGVVPIGAGMEWFSNTPPTNWYLQDGSIKSRTADAKLFAAIGTTYNTGGELSTEFRLPNKSGRAGVGRDVSQVEFDTLNKRGGAKTHTLTNAESPSHNHAVSDPGHVHSMPGHVFNWGPGGNVYLAGPQMTAGGAPGNELAAIQTTYQSTYGQFSGVGTQNSGGGGAHNNLSPYVVQNYIIRHA